MCLLFFPPFVHMLYFWYIFPQTMAVLHFIFPRQKEVLFNDLIYIMIIFKSECLSLNSKKHY